jgi:hypothetical protein
MVYLTVLSATQDYIMLNGRLDIELAWMLKEAVIA